jgi:hypothetical protein
MKQQPRWHSALTVVLVCWGTTAFAQAHDRVRQAQDYVLAACITGAYAGQPLAEESQQWAQGLVEFGQLPGTVYKPLNDLARSAPPPKTSTSGTPMLLQNCVNWAGSTQVKTGIQKILARSQN